MSDVHDELARELRQRAGAIGGHPLDLESVTRRARTIRRRRRAAGGVAAAAVLALAVPAGVAIVQDQQDTGMPPVGPVTGAPTASSDTPRSTDASPEPTSDTDTQSPESPESRDPARAALTVSDAPRGAPAELAYLDRRTLVEPGGERTVLPARYTDIAPHRGGWIGLRYDADANPVVDFLDASGRVASSVPSTGGFALNAEGSRVAYVADGTLQLAATRGDGGVVSLSTVGSGVTLVGVVGTGIVYYNTDGQQPSGWFSDLHGQTAKVSPFSRISGVSADGMLAGVTSVTDTGSCSATGRSGRLGIKTCDYTLGDFSPSGRYILADEAYHDGLGSSQVAILDAGTGDLVAQYDRPDASGLFVADVAWEDDSHVLAVVHDSGWWRLIRLDLTGAVEAVAPPVKADEFNRPYYFAATP